MSVAFDHLVAAADLLPGGRILCTTRRTGSRVSPRRAAARPGCDRLRRDGRNPGGCPALEIVDSRIADWRITLADTIADNASSGAVVLGQWVPIAPAPLLLGTTATLAVNDTTVGTGAGTAAMGDPAAAVAWLANALAAFDIAIEAGQFVISGSCTTASFVVTGDRTSAHIGGLGTVTATFE